MPTEDDKKLRFGTIAWFKFAWGCVRYKDYNARDVAVDGVSSARSYGTAGFLTWVNLKAPWIFPALKGLASKIAGVFVAAYGVTKDFVHLYI